MNMLQIIHVANIGGAEKHTRLISKEFARRGFPVTLIYPPGPYAGEYAALTRWGVKCIEHDLKATPLRTIGFVRRIIKEKKIEIVHSHMHGADFVAMCARAGLGVRHISTIHAIPQDNVGLLFKVRSTLMTFLAFHSMEKIFAVSAPVAERIRRELLLPCRKVAVTLNSIDFGEMKPDAAAVEKIRSMLKTTPTMKIIMCIGSLYRLKGQSYLIEAFYAIAQTHPDCRLVFLGRGEAEEELRSLTQRLGLGERVVFAGHHLNVADWLSAADIYVQPSAYLDPLPRALLEAMYMGLPVVASDVASIRQVVTDRMNGLCVAPRSPDAIAAALRYLLENPAEGRRMGLAGQAFVQKNCSMTAMADRICAALGIEAGVGKAV